jgi:hypothetical protein
MKEAEPPGMHSQAGAWEREKNLPDYPGPISGSRLSPGHAWIPAFAGMTEKGDSPVVPTLTPVLPPAILEFFAEGAGTAFLQKRGSRILSLSFAGWVSRPGLFRRQTCV